MTKIFMHSVAAAALLIGAPAAFAQSPQPNREMAQTSTSDQATPGAKHEHHGAADERGSAGAAAKGSAQTDSTEGKSGTSADTRGSAQTKGSAAVGNRDESRGSSAASSEAKPSEKSSAQKSQQGSERSSQARSKGEEHGNAASPDKTTGSTAGSEHSRTNGAATATQDRNAGSSSTSASGSAHENAAMGEGGHKIAPGKVNRIREAIRGEHVERISHADFSVRVGTVIPSHYHFYPLPEDIVSIVPEYRGYDYVVVSDEILIVEPQSHRIVYTLPENESASAEGHHRSNCD
jgi:hypothetical protein